MQKNVLKSTFQLKIMYHHHQKYLTAELAEVKYDIQVCMYVYLDEEDEMRIRWAQRFECLHLLLLSIS